MAENERVLDVKKRIVAKLKSQAGESIGETLIALLISALALTMLAGAVSTAANLIKQSDTKMTSYYAGINALGNPAPAEHGKMAINLSADGTDINLVYPNDGISVVFSVNDAFPKKPVIAYKKDS